MGNDMVIVGPRQAGKTHISVVMAVETAAAGGQVLFQGRDRQEDAIRFRDCLDRAEQVCPDQIEKFYRSNGQQRILFKTGGRLCFSALAYDYFDKLDLHVIDDASGEARPNAERSIKTVTI